MKKLFAAALFLMAAKTVRSENAVTLYDPTGNNYYIQMAAPSGMASNCTLVMPLTVGTTNQVLGINAVTGSTVTLAFLNGSSF